MEQGTPEWFAARAGRVTASKIADVMAKGRGNAPSATRSNYMAQLVAERLTGNCAETFKSAAMDHGTETEPQARAQYTMTTGRMVEEVAFIPHPDGWAAGASPDGLVGDDGMLEIKCPNTATHIATLRGAKIDRKYMLQMHWQMICAGRKWCDFASYDPRMPDELALHIRRVELDHELTEDINAAVWSFMADLDALEAELSTMREAA